MTSDVSICIVWFHFHTSRIIIRDHVCQKVNLSNTERDFCLGSACEAGEFYRAIVGGRPQEEIIRLVKFYDYLEIQPLGNNEFMLRSDKEPVNTMEELQDINRRICKTGGGHLTSLWWLPAMCISLTRKMKSTAVLLWPERDLRMLTTRHRLYLRTTEEMLKEFEYLG